MSRLLALDQSTKITGWSFFEDGELVDYGKINAIQTDLGDRLVYIKKEINNLIDTFNIDEVIMEDIQMQNNVVNNVQTFKVLSEVFGVISETLQEKKMKYTVVMSGTWKSTLGIKGRTRPEQKRNAQEYVLNKYGVKAIQDVCDAICIGAHVLKRPGVGTTVSDGFDWAD